MGLLTQPIEVERVLYLTSGAMSQLFGSINKGWRPMSRASLPFFLVLGTSAGEGARRFWRTTWNGHRAATLPCRWSGGSRRPATEGLPGESEALQRSAYLACSAGAFKLEAAAPMKGLRGSGESCSRPGQRQRRSRTQRSPISSLAPARRIPVTLSLGRSDCG